MGIKATELFPQCSVGPEALSLPKTEPAVSVSLGFPSVEPHSTATPAASPAGLAGSSAASGSARGAESTAELSPGSCPGKQRAPAGRGLAQLRAPAALRRAPEPALSAAASALCRTYSPARSTAGISAGKLGNGFSTKNSWSWCRSGFWAVFNC